MRRTKGARLVLLLASVVGCASTHPIPSGVDVATIVIPRDDVTRTAIVLDDAANVKVPRGSRVLLVGDSLAVGLYPTLSRLSKAAGYSLTSSAESGTSTRYWARRVTREIVARRPHLVLVCLGTNDAIHAGKSDAIELAWFDDVVNAARSRGSLVVWIEPPRIEKSVPRVEEVRTIVRSLDVDNFRTSDVLDVDLSDGVHPTGLGYSRWSAGLWLWLEARGTVQGKTR